MKEKENIKVINGKYGKAEFIDQKVNLPKEVTEGDYFRMALLGVMRSTKNSIYIIGNQLKEISEKLENNNKISDIQKCNIVGSQKFDLKENIDKLYDQIISYSKTIIADESNFKENKLKELITKYINNCFDKKDLFSYINIRKSLKYILCNILNTVIYKKISNNLKGIEFRRTENGESCCTFTTYSNKIKMNDKEYNIEKKNSKCTIIPIERKINLNNNYFDTYSVDEIYTKVGILPIIYNFIDSIEAYIVSKIDKNSKRVIIIFENGINFLSNNEIILSMGIGQE